jgi:hypothetical protein
MLPVVRSVLVGAAVAAQQAGNGRVNAAPGCRWQPVCPR